MSLPPIGARVRYRGPLRCAQGATGHVIHHRPSYPDPDNPHAIAPREDWTISVELERLPPTWPYLTRSLAAKAADLEIIASPARRAKPPRRR